MYPDRALSPLRRARATRWHLLHARAAAEVRLRTRRTDAKPDLVFALCAFDQNERHRSSPVGCPSHPVTDRPSVGNAARNVVVCDCTRRRFMTLSATITHTATFLGNQPRSLAIVAASRRFLSIVPISSLMSTISVLSSITRSVRVGGCQAKMSITPRSPRMANETSGAIIQSMKRRNARATDSCSAE